MSSDQELIPMLQAKLGGSIIVQADKLGKISLHVEADAHLDVLRLMKAADEKTAVSAITSVDLGDKLGVLYHMRTSHGIITVKTELSKENAEIASITNILPGASFHEREVFDLLGVSFRGHPNLKRLVLPETWPEGVYPLRKDVNAASVQQVSPSEWSQTGNEEDGNLVKVVIGPQHPALLEPEKFTLKVEGETVCDVEPRIGYVHRGIEKAAEGRTYLQDVYLVERICGICNSCHAVCFCEAVEKILNLEVPPRAKYIRTILLELNRLHSHMLLLGHAGLEIGYETLFQYMWRDRETVMDLTEMLTGNRVIASAIAVGGVRRDIRESDVLTIKKSMVGLRAKMEFYKQLYHDDPTLKMRTQHVGTLSRKDALDLCVVGPVARGSDVDIDVRKDEPYEAYGEIPFKLITYTSGDSWARLMVRLDEINESIGIIEYALDNLPVGAYRVRAPRIVPSGEAVNRVEAPRGELFYYVKSNGTAYPERVKVRTPTFANIPAFVKTAVGENVADVPANFVSLDPCFSCTDR
jgi:Ni,Fe-hydrogenase III large subunit/NADH:ubiquinone oxidoreductase subunit C